ncbi:MAG: hypothetical protein ACRDCG_02435 [Mycoplasmoidaceae bacterium]
MNNFKTSFDRGTIGQSFNSNRTINSGGFGTRNLNSSLSPTFGNSAFKSSFSNPQTNFYGSRFGKNNSFFASNNLNSQRAYASPFQTFGNNNMSLNGGSFNIRNNSSLMTSFPNSNMQNRNIYSSPFSGKSFSQNRNSFNSPTSNNFSNFNKQTLFPNRNFGNLYSNPQFQGQQFSQNYSNQQHAAYNANAAYDPNQQQATYDANAAYDPNQQQATYDANAAYDPNQQQATYDANAAYDPNQQQATYDANAAHDPNQQQATYDANAAYDPNQQQDLLNNQDNIMGSDVAIEADPNEKHSLFVWSPDENDWSLVGEFKNLKKAEDKKKKMMKSKKNNYDDTWFNIMPIA